MNCSWNSQNGQSLLWNQWAVSHRSVCPKHDSLIPKATRNKRSFHLCAGNKEYFSLFHSFSLYPSFFLFLSVSPCFFFCLTHILSVIKHAHLMSPKHKTLDNFCLWHWQWKSMSWIRMRAVGRHRLVHAKSLPSALLECIGQVSTSKDEQICKLLQTLSTRCGG